MPGVITHINFARGYRGGERQTQLLMEALAEAGFDQRLITRSDSELARRCEGVPRLQVRQLRKPYLLRLGVLRGSRLLHAHETKGAHFAYLGHLRYRIPYLITRRVDHPIRNNRFNRALYGSASAVAALSEPIRREILRILPSRDVTIIPSAWSPMQSDPAETARLRARHAGSFVVGHIGALVDAHKGQSLLIDAARLLAERCPGLHLLLVGSGKDEARLKARASELENVAFAGFAEEVAPYLKSFDLFAFPSRYEGLGSILLDAMRFRLPIIAAETGGIPELVTHEQNGLLVPPGDAAALAEAIERLYRDVSLRERLAQTGYATSERFSPGQMQKRYLELYRRIAPAHPEKAPR